MDIVIALKIVTVIVLLFAWISFIYIDISLYRFIKFSSFKLDKIDYLLLFGEFVCHILALILTLALLSFLFG